MDMGRAGHRAQSNRIPQTIDPTDTLDFQLKTRETVPLEQHNWKLILF